MISTLTKRIIPCLDVKDGKVVKGVKFRNHEVVGNILQLAKSYSDAGADELVFYDITASCDGRVVTKEWVTEVARIINIPFCVAGGIKTIADAAIILQSGADKISINSPALENPQLVKDMVNEFGQQCVVIGIDSIEINGEYKVCQYTGDINKTLETSKKTTEWVQQVQQLGAGEIVLNCMNQDGVRQGYDIKQLSCIRDITKIPLIASGGAGNMQHFADVFTAAKVDAALAASVFHKGVVEIRELKTFLRAKNIEVRLDEL